MRFFKKLPALRMALVIISVLALSYSCSKLEDQEKYQRPDWLAGKIYSQLKKDSTLSVFTLLLERTGYDKVLDLTGSFTVFAPDNRAFASWLDSHPEFGGDITNIPYSEAEAIVQYHILQNRWSREQFQSLDINGWIDENDPGNNKPRGYKQQTLYNNPDQKYYVKKITNGVYTIVDSTESNDYRMVQTTSRKYLPIFFEEYLNVYDLKRTDYEYYFDRSFEGDTSIYVANAKVTTREIPTENGFIYKVDQVIKQPVNAEEYLKMEHTGATTKRFLEMIYEIPSFSQNLIATFNQPEALAGGTFDTLYNLGYPMLTFNIQEELTGPNKNFRHTVRYHNGLLVPTDQALEKLVNEVLTSNSGYPRWSSWDAIPKEVRKIIINTHMSESPIYHSDFQNGFINGALDKMYLDESVVRDRYYGSNASILLIDDALVSRAFTSITNPVYLRPGYSTMLYAMEYSNTLSTLKKPGKEYIFFVPSDETMAEDSSLILNWINKNNSQYRFDAYNQRELSITRNISRNELAKRILNQVAAYPPKGIARREFIENLAGNFLVFDNENNTVTGGVKNAWGYLGDSAIVLEPVLFEEPTDNGLAYKFEGWFNTPIKDLFTAISEYPHFMNLINKANLYNPQLYTFNFLNDGDIYTVFIPNENALANAGLDKLSVTELQQFIKSHFIKGTRVWTDGSVTSGAYQTLRVDESSSPIRTVYTSMNIETGYDYIDILDKDGHLYYRIDEDTIRTNIMIANKTVARNPGPHDYIITGVIHEIDTVLHKALVK